MRNKILVTISIIVILILATLTVPRFHSEVKADMAPPNPAVGSDLLPENWETNVRMMSEYVLLDIAGYSSYPSGHANVTAQFFMHNLGDVSEQMRARFPMNHAYYDLESELGSQKDYCAYSPMPSLDGLRVWVDQVEVDVDISYERMTDYMAPPNDNFDPVYIDVPCWAYFDLTFPPGEDVEVKVAYTVPGYNYQGGGYRGYYGGGLEFAYVLGTGAGWADTIGKAVIVARLPYDINALNLDQCIPEDCLISGKEITWQYEDFEPQGNVALRIMRPMIWQTILEETARVKENPNDGEAWGRLGKANKEGNTGAKGVVWIYDERTKELFDLSVAAYQKAVDLLPNDADWHYGFAELLCDRPLWNEPTYDNWRACIVELKLALDLEPEHEMSNHLLERIDSWGSWMENPLEIVDLNGAQPVYLILTHTQGPTPTSTETAPPTPTRTKLVKTSTPTQTVVETPTTKPETPSATPELAPTQVPELTETAQVFSTAEDTVRPQRVGNAMIYLAAFLVFLLVVALILWERGS